MTLRIILDLSEKDLRHFRRLMRDARKLAKQKNEDEAQIVAAADGMLRSVREANTSEFVEERLAKLELMIRMLRDDEWQIPVKEKTRVIHALTYFAEEDDLIPDDIPVIGFLDDAIMIELVVRELRHEIEAYEDFCRFRVGERERRRRAPDHEAADRLAVKRKALHERMRRRASRNRRAARSGGPRLTLF